MRTVAVRPLRHVHGHDRPRRGVTTGSVSRCCCGIVLVAVVEGIPFSSPYVWWRPLYRWPFDRAARRLAGKALR